MLRVRRDVRARATVLRHAASRAVVNEQGALFDLPVASRLAWREVTVRGKTRLLCERCGGTVAVPKGAAMPRSKGHDVQHARSSIVELRIGRRQVPIVGHHPAYLLKRGVELEHDQWGSDTAKELGLPIVEHPTTLVPTETDVGLDRVYANAPDAVTVGAVVALDAPERVSLASASNPSRAAIGLVMELIDDETCVVREQGKAAVPWGERFSVGRSVFLSETGGELTQTPPVTVGSIVQQVGVAVSSTSVILGATETLALGYDYSAFDGLPWSLHWLDRDVAGDALLELPKSATALRSWLRVWMLAVDLAAATRAPWWLCAHVAAQRNPPFRGPTWAILDAGVGEAPELAERIAALGTVAACL